MNLKLHSGVEVYLDGLIIECILSTFRAADLATLSQVCHAMRAPAQLAAHRTLVMLIKRMQATLLRHLERGSWIAQLRDWEAIEATNLLWLQAGETPANLVPSSGEDRLVQSAADLSGHGHVATMHHEMPVFRPDAVNGLPAFEFEGNSVLKTKPFAQPLPQPITIVVVAKARGDTTIFDSLGSRCAHAQTAPVLARRPPVRPPRKPRPRLPALRTTTEKCMHATWRAARKCMQGGGVG